MTAHEDRLTTVNRKLVEDLNQARAFIRRLLNPEDFGHAVTQEVREEARRTLGMPTK